MLTNKQNRERLRYRSGLTAVREVGGQCGGAGMEQKTETRETAPAHRGECGDRGGGPWGRKWRWREAWYPGGDHTVQCVQMMRLDLCTRNLCSCVTQCHPNIFSKQEKKCSLSAPNSRLPMHSAHTHETKTKRKLPGSFCCDVGQRHSNSAKNCVW